MAQLVVKHGPTAAATRKANIITDWDSSLHSLWLDIIKTNPRFYDDIKVSHAMGRCKCRCTASPFLTEVHRRK